MTPVWVRTSSTSTVSSITSEPDCPMPVTSLKRSRLNSVTTCGRKAASTTSMGISASNPWAAMIMHRSMTSIRTSSSTVRRSGGTVSSSR